MSVTLEYFGRADIMPPLFIGCAPAYFLRRFLVRQFPATAVYDIKNAIGLFCLWRFIHCCTII
ncbi:MAG: hypothetical protein DBY00_02860 [Flavobacteriales bacterium]|nr:MAG: hypothetical protein DBY00_02860 [Flavobacteriales bacterium]